MTNKEFAQTVSDADSYEVVYQLFVDNGLDAAYEDFPAYIQASREFMVEKGLISEDGELSPEMPDMVSGGSVRGKAILTLARLVCICAGRPGLAVGCFILARLH